MIKLAESSGAAIIPVHVRFASAWRLKTWDRFVIPKPFSRVEVTFGEAIHLPRGMAAHGGSGITCQPHIGVNEQEMRPPRRFRPTR